MNAISDTTIRLLSRSRGELLGQNLAVFSRNDALTLPRLRQHTTPIWECDSLLVKLLYFWQVAVKQRLDCLWLCTSRWLRHTLVWSIRKSMKLKDWGIRRKMVPSRYFYLVHLRQLRLPKIQRFHHLRESPSRVCATIRIALFLQRSLLALTIPVDQRC